MNLRWVSQVLRRLVGRWYSPVKSIDLESVPFCPGRTFGSLAIESHRVATQSMSEVETVFKALGDANRLRIVNLLLHGEFCVCDIQYVLQNLQPNTSGRTVFVNYGRRPRRRYPKLNV